MTLHQVAKPHSCIQLLAWWIHPSVRIYIDVEFEVAENEEEDKGQSDYI